MTRSLDYLLTYAALAAPMLAVAGVAASPARAADPLAGFPDLSAPVLSLDLPASQPDTNSSDLTNLSMEDLMNIQVTSVSKQPQRVGDAPAAIYVITQDDIHRSGMSTIADMLRMAPGMDVGQASAGQWGIGARGLNSVRNDNLLVLMDGRTLYNTFFSGVYWDQVDYVLNDLDRIEVVRGPGATLWGANAVNGVINIVTKSAEDTQGLLVNGYGGTDGNDSSVRYGGNVDNRVFYRVYGKYRSMDDFPEPGHPNNYDGWDSRRGGFRVDAHLSPKDLLTVQGDLFQNRTGAIDIYPSLTPPFSPEHSTITNSDGENILGRWTHTFSDDSDFTVQAYYDRLNWEDPPPTQDTQQTYDIEFQHRFPLLTFNEIIWGAGYRMVTDDLRNAYPTSIQNFSPARRDNSYVNSFIQDDVTIVPQRLHLIAGTKVEELPYTNLSVEPSGRILFTPNEKNTLWGAVSGAVRSPARWEEDVHGIADVVSSPASPLPIEAVISGNRALDPEQLTALEAGYRVEPLSSLSLDFTGFYNFYHGIISEVVTGAPTPSFTPAPHLVLPIRTANMADGNSYGAEVSAQWKVADNWRLEASYSFLQVIIRSPDAIQGTETAWNGSSPKHQFQIRSYYDITRNLELNAALYFVDQLHTIDPGIGSSLRADANIVWRPDKHVELTAGFRNIFDNRHPEFIDYQKRINYDSEVPRSFFVSMSLKF